MKWWGSIGILLAWSCLFILNTRWDPHFLFVSWTHRSLHIHWKSCYIFILVAYNQRFSRKLSVRLKNIFRELDVIILVRRLIINVGIVLIYWRKISFVKVHRCHVVILCIIKLSVHTQKLLSNLVFLLILLWLQWVWVQVFHA